jgi:phosphatidylinositol glycan class N
LPVASLTIPFLHSLDPINHYLHRFLILFLAFAPSFVILTISWEGLFYVAFCFTMLTWVRLEHLIYKHGSEIAAPVSEGTPPPPKAQKGQNGKALNGKAKRAAHNGNTKKSSPPPVTEVTVTSTPHDGKIYRPLTLSDVRPSLFTLYLLQSAFFSTGNIASVSSFSLDAVYRLIPVFDPFSQGALLILKILIPFVILSAALGILNKRLGFAPGALFMGLIVCGDWLTINFYWMVRDEGSWLEIGETISRFCIVSALCVFTAALEGASTWLVGGIEDDAVVVDVAGEKK